MTSIPEELSAVADAHPEIFRFWAELSETEQQALAAQVSSIDFGLLIETRSDGGEDEDSAARADRAAAPSSVVLQPSSDADRTRWDEALKVGETMLAEGNVDAGGWISLP